MSTESIRLQTANMYPSLLNIVRETQRSTLCTMFSSSFLSHFAQPLSFRPTCVTRNIELLWTAYNIVWLTVIQREKNISEKHQRGINKNLWFLRHLYFYDLEKSFFFQESRQEARRRRFLFFTMENISRLTTNLIWIENDDTTRLGSTRARGRVMGDMTTTTMA